MITMLNVWSFELNSNKSVGTPNPSIPVPSNGHFASKNLRVAGAYAPIVAGCHPSHFSHSSYHSRPSSIPSGSRFGTVNSVNRRSIHVCNRLISRVCTVLHVNKDFFSTLRASKKTTSQKTMLRPTAHFTKYLCVLCVTLFRKIEPSTLNPKQNDL
jgi:hypothetical protein